MLSEFNLYRELPDEGITYYWVDPTCGTIEKEVNSTKDKARAIGAYHLLHKNFESAFEELCLRKMYEANEISKQALTEEHQLDLKKSLFDAQLVLSQYLYDNIRTDANELNHLFMKFVDIIIDIEIEIDKEERENGKQNFRTTQL